MVNGDSELEEMLGLLKSKIEKGKFCLANIKKISLRLVSKLAFLTMQHYWLVISSWKISFYTGFPNYATLLSCNQFLEQQSTLMYDSNKQCSVENFILSIALSTCMQSEAILQELKVRLLQIVSFLLKW